MLSRSKLSGHRIQNTLQSVLIIMFMAGILSLSAYLILGEGFFYVILFMTLLVLSLQPRLPTWLVMRLYHARPISSWEMPELLQAVQTLSNRANLENTPSLYYVPSSSMNAFATGTADESSIAITDGLLRRLNFRELTGVLAHEVSHIANSDLRVMSLADTMTRLTSVLSLIGIALLFLIIPLWITGVVKISLLAVVILVAAPLLSATLQAALSRTREFSADTGAVELTGDPKGLASALVKIDNPYGRWWQRIFQPQGGESAPSSLRTHPPTEERVNRLMSLSPVSYQDRFQPYPATSIPNVRYITITRTPRRHWSGLWY